MIKVYLWHNGSTMASIWTLQEFQKAFNEGKIDPENDQIQFFVE